MLFLSQYVQFTQDDFILNSQALTWYERMQPIYLSTEVNLLNNREYWMKALKARIVSTGEKLQEYSFRLGEFKARDRFSEAASCVAALNKMTQEIQGFHQTIKNINHEEELFGFDKVKTYLQTKTCGMVTSFRKTTCSNLYNLSLYSSGIFLNIFLIYSILKVASLLFCSLL